MNLQDVILSQWIEFTDSIKELTDRGNSIADMVDSRRKEILQTQNHVEKAFAWAKFFNIDGEYVNDVLEAYNEFMGQLDDVAPLMETPVSDITFGQFIDSKMMTANADVNIWRQMQYIITIFCTDYEPEYLSEEHERFKVSGALDMRIIVAGLKWFESLNNTINTTYTVFQESGLDEGDHMKEHMRRWGWINFLKSVAKTKVFDISGSGLNSIDCARAAKLDDVLIWASEEKEYNVAMSLDMESK